MIPAEAGNAAAKAGKLGTMIQSILEDLKPGAVYFTGDRGQLHPVMVPEDIARAGGALEAAVKRYS